MKRKNCLLMLIVCCLVTCSFFSALVVQASDMKSNITIEFEEEKKGILPTFPKNEPRTSTSTTEKSDIGSAKITRKTLPQTNDVRRFDLFWYGFVLIGVFLFIMNKQRKHLAREKEKGS